MNLNELLPEVAKVHIATGGYLVLEFFQEDVVLKKQEVDYGWSLAKAVDPDKTKPVFLKTAKWSLLDDQARSFVINEIRSWPSVAIVVHNLAQKLMGNFALRMTGKSKSICIFECENEAIAWLEKKVKI